MALNMDDLIGSMQHGFHAGDRGNELNEIRESLKMSLGQQHPPHNSSTSTSAAGPSNSQYAFAARRNPFQPQHGASSLDADVAMLSSSNSYQQQQHQGYYPPSFFGGAGAAGGPGSWGSQSSASSSTGGFPPGSGWGFAPAPANTPQQTPVEASALARQLQAELEKQSAAPHPHYALHSTAPPHHPASPPPPMANSTSPPMHPPPVGDKNGVGAGDEPRSYVNGFAPRDDSATPVGRGSLSPQPQHARFG
ncbi:conserved hypothetical protein [Sporisorium reilianum SRZ2]|uniref:Uncharacterized protein n=1 Tax=Sporisorium reilianum (strain SRZ2) TaxID=999809 RepID=E6ZTZ7_SPORE|nr:conserved hypothetical protein [Sporisorium reilianum SRZ2]